jgi:uncharacterized LabA/DUF88 family protein
MTDIENDLPFSTELIHQVFPDIKEQAHAEKVISNELIINDLLPGLVRGEATALLLDVNNLFKRAQANDFRIDYGRLMRIFGNRCDLRYCGAFSSVLAGDINATNWVSYMESQGYSVVTKDLYQYELANGAVISKGNMDVEMTIAAMKLNSAFAHVIIGTCDGDFSELIKELKTDNFRKVSVMGLKDKDWSGMSDMLIRSADNFYDMGKLKEFISYRRSDERSDG